MKARVDTPVRTELPARRWSRGRIVTGATIALVLAGLAVWGGYVSNRDRDRDAVEAAPGTVEVTVQGLEGAFGGQIAGVLIPGSTGTPVDRSVGGFTADIDTDPFMTHQFVREPSEAFVGPFPYVGDATLSVDPGTYTLSLWWRPDGPLLPYSRWVPATQEGLAGCATVIEIPDGGSAAVTITGDFTLEWVGVAPRCITSP
jgi:hypothetical protein